MFKVTLLYKFYNIFNKNIFIIMDILTLNLIWLFESIQLYLKFIQQ